MLNFVESVENGHGKLIISGLKINHGAYDPIAKIWSTIRKKNRSLYGVDVAGAFFYPDDDTIVCNLYLNYAFFENSGYTNKIAYDEKFISTFAYQTQNFRDAIVTFIESPDGAKAYNNIAGIALFEDADKVMNNFLHKYGFKFGKPRKN